MNAITLTQGQDKKIIKKDVSILTETISSQIEQLSSDFRGSEQQFFLAALRIKSASMESYIFFSNTSFENRGIVISLIGDFITEVFCSRDISLATIRKRLHEAKEMILSKLEAMEEAERSDLEKKEAETA